jgi:hypothetical protein
MSTRRPDLRFLVVLWFVMLLSVVAGCSSDGSGGGGSSDAVLKSIQITPDNSILLKGAALQLKAAGTYSDSSTRDITAEVSWFSSVSGVASVNSSGLVAGLTAGTTVISATKGGITDTTNVNVTEKTAALVPDPPADDATYFQIMIDNRVGSGHTVHLGLFAAKMVIPTTSDKPAIIKRTWLTGGGGNFDDWTQPVFQTLDSLSGSASGASFTSTASVQLDKLPKDSTGQYRVLKIPFLMPGNSSYTLAGSGRLYISLDDPLGSIMKINTSTDVWGFDFAMPDQNSTAKDAGGLTRFDVVELNCATQFQNGRPVCFVDTTNVDFFSLGLVFRGRDHKGDVNTYGIDLGKTTVAATIDALKNLGGNYAAGLRMNGSAFLRFLAPSLSFADSATDFKAAIDAAYISYINKDLVFTVGGTTYAARASAAGDALVFSTPSSFTVSKPTTKEAIGAIGSFNPAGKSDNQKNAEKFIAAYINRGVFDNTSLWYTSSKDWYPAGKAYNQYSALLHALFVGNLTYGFSYDDVPSSDTLRTVPAISSCTSMSLVISDQ